ncbi:MAG: transporter substrate-binding domain-containing protein, partial [Weissella cibaria]
MQKWVTKIMAAVMTMMMLVGMVAPASAAQTYPVLSKIEKSGKLVVGTSADYAPYEFHTTVNGKDKIVGFDISVANEIAKRLGVKLVIQEMSFDALLGAVKTGKVDMVVAGMTATPEREQEASFSEPYFVDKNVVMTLKKNANKLTNLNDLKKATLAAQLSSIQEDAAKQVDAKKVVSLKKVNDAVTQLTQGKVDGVVVPDTTADS